MRPRSRPAPQCRRWEQRARLVWASRCWAGSGRCRLESALSLICCFCPRDGRRKHLVKQIWPKSPRLDDLPLWVATIAPLVLGNSGILRALDPSAPRALLLVALEGLVDGLARNPELATDRCHCVAVENPSDKPQALVHHRTLLPGIRISLQAGKCYPCVPVRTVTSVLDRSDLLNYIR